MEDRSSKWRNGFDLRSRSPDEIEEDVYAPYPAARSPGCGNGCTAMLSGPRHRPGDGKVHGLGLILSHIGEGTCFLVAKSSSFFYFFVVFDAFPALLHTKEEARFSKAPQRIVALPHPSAPARPDGETVLIALCSGPY